MKRSAQSGITTLLVIAFMGIFLLIMGTITSFAFEESKYGRALLGREQALHVAESGLEYYRWFLAHSPGNLTNGTGAAGPYSYEVDDPETSASIGTASVSVAASTQCGQIQYIDLTSTGRATANPGFPRTLFARYMRKSVANYSYLLNSNVWAGPDRTITGPYFSNGGIRMDGTNNSDVLSPVTSWSCDSNYGCSPTQSSANGVVGSGSGSILWQWGSNVSSIDFSGMQANMSNLKTYAQNNGGLYFAPLAGTATSRGYHLIFNSNGTVTVKQVTSTTAVPSYSADLTDSNRVSDTNAWNYGWTQTEYSIINTESSGTTYTIPASCSLIFVEDHAWIEGVVKGKVTVAVGTPSDGTATMPSVYLPNNISYATNDGTSGLTVIAEGNVLIPLNSPDTMSLHGIFVAQGGHYGRNYYTSNAAYAYYGYAVSSGYNSYVLRSQLTTQGTVVSNYRTGTSWVSSGVTTSGYQNRIDAYDQLQATDPPPFTPASTVDYNFAVWKEQ